MLTRIRSSRLQSAGGNSKAAQQLREVFLTRGKQVCLAAQQAWASSCPTVNKVQLSAPALKDGEQACIFVCGMPPQV